LKPSVYLFLKILLAVVQRCVAADADSVIQLSHYCSAFLKGGRIAQRSIETWAGNSQLLPAASLLFHTRPSLPPTSLKDLS
jgi:hypothetical protein